MRYQILCLCAWIMIYLFFSQASVLLSNSIPSNEEIQLLFTDKSAENLIALGQKLKISEIKREDLEILTGLSDSAKDYLIKNKFELLKIAKSIPHDKKHLILTKLKGIGVKKASILSEYLVFE